jgi:hypothetical protein
MLWLALSALLFIRALGVGAQAQPQQASAWNWLGYVVCSAAAVYTQFFALLVIGAQWLSIAAFPRRRESWRCLAASGTAMGVLVAPALWFVLTKNNGQLAWITRLSFTAVFKTLALLAGNPAALPLFLLLWWSAARAFANKRKEGPGATWPLLFVNAWLWTPFAITLLASLRKPILNPRFLLVSLPAAVLLAGAGLDNLRPARQRIMLAGVILLSLGGVIYYYAGHKDDWRGATAYVLASAHPGDAVFIAPDFCQLPFRYYQQGHPAPGVVLHSGEDLKGVESFPRVWVLVYGKRTEPDTKALLDHLARGYTLVSGKHFNKIDTQFYVAKGSGSTASSNTRP